MKQIVITFFASLLATIIFAQAPQAFNYQGVVRDLSGNPIPNQNIGLQIAILQNAASGTEVYKETHNTTTTDLGLFNIQVGTGVAVTGNFENIDWGSDNHFLQIELDENGASNYQLIGTSELLSVPYALYAENGSLWTKRPEGITYINSTSSNLLDSLPSINDRDVVIASDDDVSTGIRIEDFGAGGQSYSFVSTNNASSLGGGKFILYNDSGTGSAFQKTRISISENGNVGIATHEPQAKLQVSDGDIYIEEVNSGVIMKSPNGQCWRMTVNNSGQPEFNSIVCPN